MLADISAKKRPVSVSSTYYLKQHEFEEQIRKSFKKAKLFDLDSIVDESLIFDLSNSYWFDLGALLWFVSLLHKLKKQRNDLQLIFPEPEETKGENLWSFLIRWRFFETLSACVDDPVNLLMPQQISYVGKKSKYAIATGTDEYGQETFLHSSRVLEITTIRPGSDSLNDETLLGSFLEKYNDRIIISALSQLCGWDDSLTKVFVQRVVREGIHNSLLHGEGGFSNAAMRLDERNLTLAISDNGIGIPKVLRNTFRETGSHEDLLKRSDMDLIKYFTEPDMILDSRLIEFSTEKGITSKAERKGMGLYYLKSVVLSHKGELRIRSGTACVDFTQSGTDGCDNMLDSPGTMLRVRTPLKR